jgi:hypothetical protein
MALMRAPCSDAAFSSSARKHLHGNVARDQILEDLAGIRLVFVDRVAGAVSASVSSAIGRDQLLRGRNLR